MYARVRRTCCCATEQTEVLTIRVVAPRVLQLVSKPLSAAIGCKARGSAFSVKRVLDVLQYASEPFSPRALITSFSLDLASKQVLKPVVENPDV